MRHSWRSSSSNIITIDRDHIFKSGHGPLTGSFGIFAQMQMNGHFLNSTARMSKSTLLYLDSCLSSLRLAGLNLSYSAATCVHSGIYFYFPAVNSALNGQYELRHHSARRRMICQALEISVVQQLVKYADKLL